MRRRPVQKPTSVDEPAWHAGRGQHDDRPDSADTTEANSESGGFIAGYRVIRLLGSGDRGSVYLGHSGSGSPVALKVFHADTDPASIELDITVLSSAAAAGLVRLLDVARLGDGRICLVLERLAGGSLARYLADHACLSVGEAVTILAPVTVALDALHTAGFAHGSLSQATILLDADGRAVLTGFGKVQRLGAAARERMAALRADYTRLGAVLAALVDALDTADSHRDSGAAVVQRFERAGDPARNGTVSGRTDAGAPVGSVLADLEHDLFDWAAAEPLRGFQPDVATENRRGSSTLSLRTLAQKGNTRTQLQTDDDHDAAGFDDEFTRDFDNEFSSGFDQDRDAYFPRGPVADVRPGRFGCAADAARRLVVHGAGLLRAARPHARLGRAIDAVADSHPLKAAGHELRKRLHGHQRPVVVATLGGSSVLVLALTLLPVSGRAGESVPADPAGGTASATHSPTPAPGAATGAAPDEEASVAPPAEVDDVTHTDQAAILGDDPLTAVPALLARRAACLAAASLVCLVDVDQTGSAMLASDSYDARQQQQGGPGRVLVDYTQYVSSLGERSGDLAVVDLTPAPGQKKSQPTSILVVKGEGGWRLREIFDY